MVRLPFSPDEVQAPALVVLMSAFVFSVLRTTQPGRLPRIARHMALALRFEQLLRTGRHGNWEWGV